MKLQKKMGQSSGTNGCGDPRKPPLGPSTAPSAGGGGALRVPRSQVCLSTFYKDCSETNESEADYSCEPTDRDGRSVNTDFSPKKNVSKSNPVLSGSGPVQSE